MLHVTILGLWHLGSVTADCLARHNCITGLDSDEMVLAGLHAAGRPCTSRDWMT